MTHGTSEYTQIIMPSCKQKCNTKTYLHENKSYGSVIVGFFMLKAYNFRN